MPSLAHLRPHFRATAMNAITYKITPEPYSILFIQASILSFELRAKQWTPALMEFVAEVTPKIVTIVLARLSPKP